MFRVFGASFAALALSAAAPASAAGLDSGGAANGFSAALGAVTKPATWGMMLLGVGAFDFGMARRQAATARVRFA